MKNVDDCGEVNFFLMSVWGLAGVFGGGGFAPLESSWYCTLIDFLFGFTQLNQWQLLLLNTVTVVN